MLRETRCFKYEIKRETISKNNLINDMATLSVTYKKRNNCCFALRNWFSGNNPLNHLDELKHGLHQT